MQLLQSDSFLSFSYLSFLLRDLLCCLNASSVFDELNRLCQHCNCLFFNYLCSSVSSPLCRNICPVMPVTDKQRAWIPNGPQMNHFTKGIGGGHWGLPIKGPPPPPKLTWSWKDRWASLNKCWRDQVLAESCCWSLLGWLQNGLFTQALNSLTNQSVCENGEIKGPEWAWGFYLHHSCLCCQPPGWTANIV